MFLYAYSNANWVASDYGIRFDINPWLSASIGLGIYLIYVISLDVVIRLTGHADVFEDASFAAMCRLWPRERTQKRAMFVALCCLNPITEEFLYWLRMRPWIMDLAWLQRLI